MKSVFVDTPNIDDRELSVFNRIIKSRSIINKLLSKESREVSSRRCYFYHDYEGLDRAISNGLTSGLNSDNVHFVLDASSDSNAWFQVASAIYCNPKSKRELYCLDFSMDESFKKTHSLNIIPLELSYSSLMVSSELSDSATFWLQKYSGKNNEMLHEVSRSTALSSQDKIDIFKSASELHDLGIIPSYQDSGSLSWGNVAETQDCVIYIKLPDCLSNKYIKNSITEMHLNMIFNLAKSSEKKVGVSVIGFSTLTDYSSPDLVNSLIVKNDYLSSVSLIECSESPFLNEFSGLRCSGAGYDLYFDSIHRTDFLSGELVPRTDVSQLLPNGLFLLKYGNNINKEGLVKLPNNLFPSYMDVDCHVTLSHPEESSEG